MTTNAIINVDSSHLVFTTNYTQGAHKKYPFECVSMFPVRIKVRVSA